MLVELLEEEALFEKKMVWIFGSPRSGSTWLGKQLLNHPENIFWNEPYLGVHFAIKSSHVNRNHYLFSESQKKNWLPELKKFILSCAYIHTQTRQKNLIIKEPNGSMGSGILLECFPNSKLIFLLRDGRDVVDSLIDAHRPNSWNKDLSSKILDSQIKRNVHIEKYSKTWVHLTNFVLSVYNNHNPHLRLLVKYENLRNDTFDEVKKIYNLLNIDIEDHEIEKLIEKYKFENISKSETGPGKMTRSAKPGNWEKNFSKEEKDLMKKVMGPTLRKLGYE